MLKWSICKQYLFFLSVFLFFLSSCGAKKKGVQKDNSYGTTTAAAAKTSSSKSNLKEYYADLLGVSSKQLNMDLYSFIDNWLEVPHRMGGMNKSGVDCSGFVNLVYQDVYRKNLSRTSSQMSENIKRKFDDQLKEGDLVFFSFGGKNIDHVGIYLHNDKFVHVSTKKGVIISNLKDNWYYKYFKRCGTPK